MKFDLISVNLANEMLVIGLKSTICKGREDFLSIFTFFFLHYCLNKKKYYLCSLKKQNGPFV